MPVTVEYLQDPEIIRAVYSGQVDIEKWQNSLQRVLALNAETAVSRVLLDTRLQESSPNTLHLFDFAAGLPIALKFAVVAAENSKIDFEFLETVGINRGKTIRVFDDYAAALRWLLAGT